jgi:hypothetical protein
MGAAASRVPGSRRRSARALVKGLVLDHPHLCNGLLLGGVITHWLIAKRCPGLDVLRGLEDSDVAGPVSDLCISVTGVSAVAAGFAGVVIVFGLQSGSARFRRFRWAGGQRLIGNWMAVIGTPIAASFFSLAAALELDLGHSAVARWLFEASVTLLLHASLRMLWLLSALARIVAADDDTEEKTSKRVSTDVFFGAASTRGAPGPQ